MGMKQEKDSIKGVRIRTFNTCMIVLSCIVFVGLIVSTILMPARFHRLVEHTDEYMKCEESAVSLGKASDYLTEQVRLYVQNMDVEYMEHYFEEVHVTQRRETALKDLEQYHVSDTAHDDLSAALRCSNDLMTREIYAMKLISVANGYDPATLPEEVRSVQLKRADAALEPAEMVEEARRLVFDSAYQDAKALIDSHLSHFLNSILSTMAQQQKDSEDALAQSLTYQQIFISVLFVMNVITFTVVTILIIRPLSIHIRRIKDKDLLQIIGSYEFKYLALTYNDIYELNAANEAMLMHKAEHDPMTDLINRGGFENLKLALKSSTQPIALVLIDLDNFKQINDVYGHEVGDLALRKLASILAESFRSSDYPARIGGDEFAVIMTDIQQDSSAVIERKIKRINAVLQDPEEGCPVFSISAGAAFSEQGFTEELFNQADQALYTVKKNGKGSCCIYREGVNLEQM